MKRLLLILASLSMLLTFTGTASANPWGEFDVSNNGRTAKVWQHDFSGFDSKWDTVRRELNNMAGQRGVIYNQQGHRGTGGIDYEVELHAAPLDPGIGGTDWNRVWCEGGKCRSWAEVTVNTAARNYDGHAKLHIIRHEFGHSLSAPHHPCDIRSVMLGVPYLPCPQNSYDMYYYTKHDKRDYFNNRVQGVYDDTYNATQVSDGELATMSIPAALETIEKQKVAKAIEASANADKIKVKRVNGGTLISAKYTDAEHGPDHDHHDHH